MVVSILCILHIVLPGILDTVHTSNVGRCQYLWRTLIRRSRIYELAYEPWDTFVVLPDQKTILSSVINSLRLTWSSCSPGPEISAAVQLCLRAYLTEQNYCQIFRKSESCLRQNKKNRFPKCKDPMKLFSNASSSQNSERRKCLLVRSLVDGLSCHDWTGGDWKASIRDRPLESLEV
jgi:hypothetical protein